MKRSITRFITVSTLFAACTPAPKPDAPRMQAQRTLTRSEIGSNTVLTDWVHYYQSFDTAFLADNFLFEAERAHDTLNGTIYGTFDTGFDETYAKFLVYSPNRQQYLDFDSQGWTLDEQNRALFAPDQAVHLVDIAKRKITRIAFTGPSEWVEDAYWKNDSVLVLLGNNADRQPTISLVDLHSGTLKIFRFKTVLDAESDYTALRLRKKGVNA